MADKGKIANVSLNHISEVFLYEYYVSGGSEYEISETDYVWCSSHVVSETAKQAANKFKDLAVLAVDKALSSDNVGSRTLDGWLDKAKSTYEEIKADPGGWGQALAEKVANFLEGLNN